MATTTRPTPQVGDLLREWRQRRHLSQLNLATAAEVSPRHLSFVETGRARPSRELVLHLAERLEVPLRERNTLLMAGGFAPAYHATPLEAEEMAPIRDALERIVHGHQPYPAVVVDRGWDLVTVNRAAQRILTDGIASNLLEPRPNALRIALHPEGLAPRIENLSEWAHHLLARLDRQISVAPAPDLQALAEELRGYPNVPRSVEHTELAERLFVPLVLQHRGNRLSLLSTISTFGTAIDITIAELAIESFFPADAATVRALRGAADGDD